MLSNSPAMIALKDLMVSFTVAEVFTNMQGKYVPLKDTIKSFKAIMAGELDNMAEACFYFVGGPADVHDKAKKMAAEAEALRQKQLERERLERERAAQVKA